MNRMIGALALVSALGACTGGNPNDSGNERGVGTGAQPLIDEPMPADNPDPDPDPGNTGPDAFGADLNSELTMNAVTYDPATDELVLNNMPFDGGDNEYAQDAAGSAALAGVGNRFDAYRNVGGGNRYFAVFRRSDSDFSQVTAVGTNSYIEFGFGGLAAQRLDGTGELPAVNADYVFNGEYAAIRTIIDPDTGSQVQYVSGTVRLDVDVQDFDTTGAVEGIVADRTFFDANGVRIPDLDDVNYIALATAGINFDNWTINNSTASVVSRVDNTVEATGTWEGLFTGPGGEEVAGIVFTEGTGPIGIDPATGDYIEVQVREAGGFIAER